MPDLSLSTICWFYSQKLILNLTKLIIKAQSQSLFKKLPLHALLKMPLFDWSFQFLLMQTNDAVSQCVEHQLQMVFYIVNKSPLTITLYIVPFRRKKTFSWIFNDLFNYLLAFLVCQNLAISDYIKREFSQFNITSSSSFCTTFSAFGMFKLVHAHGDILVWA